MYKQNLDLITCIGFLFLLQLHFVSVLTYSYFPSGVAVVVGSPYCHAVLYHVTTVVDPLYPSTLDPLGVTEEGASEVDLVAAGVGFRLESTCPLVPGIREGNDGSIPELSVSPARSLCPPLSWHSQSPGKVLEQSGKTFQYVGVQ